MENEITKINDWKTPSWHEDWKGVDSELELLRKYCEALAKNFNSFSFNLDTSEVGYLEVNLFKEGHLFGNLLVPSVDNQAVVFFDTKNEVEEYFQSPEELISFLKKID